MAATQIERTDVLSRPSLAPVLDGVKKTVDAGGALLLLLLLLPLMLFIALAIKINSPGRVLYTQDRSGRGGARFRFIKFRTMVPDADTMRSEVLGTPDADMVQRYRTDPRITPVGRVLRRWSVDELPQLFNVVRGDMSLVGPRPLLPEEVDLLSPQHHERHRCRPGLTGLWQVSGRKETSWEERMDLDIEYVENHSLTNDVVILGRTVGVVLRGHGAY
jgi:lipopolysaccharide/colanic/teichoic acid biosynthesis glycosyltransferase